MPRPPRPGSVSVFSGSALVAGLIALTAAVEAQWGVPRPAQPRQVAPPPAGARSVEVVDEGAPVFVEPRKGADRRGTVALGARLPLLERLGGHGCHVGAWYRVGPRAYVCEELVRPSAAAPGGTPLPAVPSGELLPHDYAFVKFDATRAFAHPSDYFADQYAEALGKGFGLVLTGRTVFDGLPFLRTRRGLWVAQEALRPVRGSDFEGVELGGPGPPSLGWVLRARAPVRARPRGKVERRAGRREVVHVAEVRGRWLRLVEGGWMDDRHVGRVTVAEPPEELEPGGRWIDVDVSEQVMVAWQGERPVYATLVSTGRGRPTHETPLGTFRVWVKLAFSDMDDLERMDVERNYAMEQVPWVQYFEGGNGFHAAFWHDSFGERRSHGCVNLSPRDARWLFGFTRPELPPGWQAILPTDEDPGTLVRIREGG